MTELLSANGCTLAPSAELASPTPDDHPTPELVEAWLAEFAVTRNPELRDRIVLAHLGLAERLAARFHEAPSITREDLQQTARMGLVAAVNRYDATRGVPFLSYAVACVVGEIKRMLRDSTWRLHVTRRIKDLALRVLPEIDRLRLTLRRAPTLVELAAHLHTTQEQVAEALEAANSRSVLSLDRPSVDRDDSSAPLGETLIAAAADDELVDRLLLPELIEHLPEIERRAVILYFFDELRQRDVAELLGCSQMHVSRLLARAIGRLRAMLLLP